MSSAGAQGLPTGRSIRLAAAAAATAAIALLAGPGHLPAVGGDASRPAPAAPVHAADAHPAAAFAKLPLAFEPNRGQTDRRVEFLARGPGYSLFLTRRGPVMRLARAGGAGPAAATPGLAAAHATPSTVFSMNLVGASTQTRIEGAGRQPGKVNYLTGDGRHTDIPTFSHARYRGVWHGIDTVFYGHGGRLEYDFDVAPHADPSQIGLRFAGARSMRVLQDGSLSLRLPGGGSVRELAPRAFQRIGGAQRTVASRYVVGRGGRVRIGLGAYDRARALVIDPVLSYSTYLGGSSVDFAAGVAVDGTGAAYVAGRTSSIDFPTTPGAAQTSSGGGVDAFVAKLQPGGSAFSYVTYVGGSATDTANGVAIDGSGAAYLTGFTGSADFPTTAGAFQTTLGGGLGVAFVLKLSAQGTALDYSTYLGGTQGATASGIAVDATGSAYVTGVTGSTDFPATSGAFQTSYAGNQDGFVTKLTPTGSALVYSTYLGGSNSEFAGRIAIDDAGAAYVVGGTGSPDFPVTAGALQTTRAGSIDPYVAKLSPSGTSLAYATYLGGSGQGIGNAVAVDGAGAAYVTGVTSSTDFPVTAGAPQPAYGGGANDAFVAKLAPSGSALGYATYLGGSGSDSGSGIAVDARGAAFVSGGTNSTDFPVTAAALQAAPAGGGDAVVAALSPQGTTLDYSTTIGGGDADQANGIAVDGAGGVYVVGNAVSTDFPTTAGAAQTTSAGASEGFALELDFAPVVATGTATAVGSSGATLNGTVDPEGSATTYRFEYGTSAAYGSRVPATDAPAGSDSGVHPVAQDISGLVPDTTYHFRIVATNAAGTRAGADGAFTTAAAAQPGPAPTSPRITGLRALHRCVRSATLMAPRESTTGLAFAFSLSQDATVRYEVLRRKDSPHWRSCPAPGGNSPVTFSSVWTATAPQTAGDHHSAIAASAKRLPRGGLSLRRGHRRVALSRLVSGQRLRWGSYVLRTTATNAAGLHSNTTAVQFWVLGRWK